MREMFRSAVASVLAVGLAVAAGGTNPRVTLSDAQVEQVISSTRVNFWGKAVGMDGNALVPSDNKERDQLLIPHAEAVRIVNEAREYGLALRCELDWQPVYSKYMQAERRKGWSEKQIAFVGMLFGVTQSAVRGWVGGTCTKEERGEVQKQLDAELNRLTQKHDP